VTVEASILCAVVIGIVVFLFYLSCYMCDMHRIETEALYVIRRGLGSSSGYASVVNGRVDWEEWNDRGLFWRLGSDYGEIEEELGKLFSRELSGALWFSVDMDSDIEVSHASVTINYEGKWHAPLERMFFYNGGVEFSGDITLSEMDQVELIRIVSAVLRGFGD